MKSKSLLLSVAAISLSCVHWAAQAGSAVFYITEDGSVAEGVSVDVNGKRQLVDAQGFTRFELDAGSYSAELSQYGTFIGEAEFSIDSQSDTSDVFVEILGGEAIAEEVSSDTANGVISGQLSSRETGGSVSGARVSVVGTDIGAMTNDDGSFSFELPRGEYEITIAHPSYERKTLSGVYAIPGVPVSISPEVGMSGSGVIEEVVAVGTYIPDSATSQERDSSAVLDSIGGEQMSRFGDSNAASALKRVAGVTITDGKYVVARGLNERHTSIMLNGATLPSPDPSRRVVPLDIFPSGVIKNIDVQKTLTPNVYADSTGSTVMLHTKKFPLEFEGSASVTLGYIDGVTLENREFQAAEGADFLGFGAGGDRALPADAKSLDSDRASLQEAREAAELLPLSLNPEDTLMTPNTSVSLSFGDALMDNGETAIGYMASLKYSNKWAGHTRQTNTNDVSSEGRLSVDDSYQEDVTTHDVDLGASLTFGLLRGDSEYTSNTMLLRQTFSDTRIKSGQGGDQDRQGVIYSMDWQERQLVMQQFVGNHYLEDFARTEIDWQVSISEASLMNPDRRTYSFERETDDGPYVLFWSSLDRTYNELSDSVVDFGTNWKSELFSKSNYMARALYGVSTFGRTRTSDGTQLGYNAGSTTARDYPNTYDANLIVAESIENGALKLQNNTTPSSDYDADWNLTAYYFGLEFENLNLFNLNVGVRNESSEIMVNTFDLISGTPVPAELMDNNSYPSVSGTLFLGTDVQLRAAWYQTLNRPDFRELANSLYVDPDSGDFIRGDSNLLSSEVTNYDLRAEWYFSEGESISLAYFNKDFINPIEKVLTTSSGTIFSYQNGDSGSVSGIEFDFRKEVELPSHLVFLSGNISLIDSEVEIAFRERIMQGQPDMLANVQIGFDDVDSTAKYTMVYNYQGESLYSATQVGSQSPDIIQQPRGELNLNYSAEIFPDLTLKAALNNLTDEEVSLTQAGANFRSYKKGRAFNLGVNFIF
ncbi:MAG: hypothetical protein ACJAY0_002345 [Thalassolituus sp.]|jgi:hypothetical protein